MKTITFMNQLGGTGKTTSAWALGTGLQKKGYKVLLVDLDCHRNLTSRAGLDQKGVADSIYEVFQGKVDVENAIYFLNPGLDILIGSLHLFGAGQEFVQGNKEAMLKEQLEKVQTGYDYCIIDTESRINLLLVSALTASDGVIIPMQDEEYALNVMEDLMKIMDYVTKECNPILKIEGFLMMNFRKVVPQEVLLRTEEIAKQIVTKVFHTIIRSTVRAEELALCDYKNFVEEFLENQKEGGTGQ